MRSIFRQSASWIVLGAAVGLVTAITAVSLPMRWNLAIVFASLFVLISIAANARAKSFLFFAFVFSLPLQLGKSFFYKPYFGGGHELRINLPEILLFSMMTLFLGDWLRNRRKAYNDSMTVWLPFLFLGLLGFSIVVAPYRNLAIFEWLRALTATLVFFITVEFIRDRATLERAIYVAIAALSVQAGIGMLQHLSGGAFGLELFGEMDLADRIRISGVQTRVGGTIGHPNAFATYLVLNLGLCIAAAATSRSRIGRLTFCGVFVVGVSALVASQSRSAWLAFSISLITIGSLYTFWSRNRVRVVGRLVKVLIVVLLVVAVLSNTIYQRLVEDDRGSALSRIPMMVDAMAMIKANPIVGTGLNNYALIVPKYDITGIHREWVDTAVHNLYLLIAAECGLPALATICLFWYLIMRHGFRAARADDEFVALMAVALLVGFLSFLLMNLVDVNYRFYPVIQREVWFLCGLMVVASRIAIQGQNRTAT